MILPNYPVLSTWSTMSFSLWGCDRRLWVLGKVLLLQITFLRVRTNTFIIELKMRVMKKNHSIWNFAIKDYLIYLDLFIQLSRSLPLSARGTDLGGDEKRYFLSWFMPTRTCFFLKLLTSFFESESSILLMVSYIPPSSLIFLAITSVCLSKYSLVLIDCPLGC